MRRTIAVSAARTAVLLWACLHVVLGFLPGPDFSAVSVVLVPALVATLVFLDQRISHEVVFLANIGIRSSVAPIAAAATALLLEVATVLVTA